MAALGWLLSSMPPVLGPSVARPVSCPAVEPRCDLQTQRQATQRAERGEMLTQARWQGRMSCGDAGVWRNGHRARILRRGGLEEQDMCCFK